MGFLPYYNSPAIIMSIVSLTAVVPVLCIFRQYFRGLDFLQLSYFLATAIINTSFSSYLYTSIAGFDKSFLTFCTYPDLACMLGFQISFGIVIVGLMFLFFLVATIQKCSKPQLTYEPVYLSLKGFLRWIYVPLVVISSKQFAISMSGVANSDYDIAKLAAAAAILGVCTLFPFFQLLGYKCIQTEQTNIWIKWIQFFNYMRLLGASVLLGLALRFQNNYYIHFVMIPLIIYPVLHIWKGEFKYPILERIIYGLGEAAFLALFYIFQYGATYITDYDLDFCLLAFVIMIDLLLYLVRGIRLGIYGVSEGKAQINPEPDSGNEPKQPKNPRLKQTKKNKYEHDSGQSLNNSRQELNLKAPPKKRR